MSASMHATGKLGRWAVLGGAACGLLWIVGAGCTQGSDCDFLLTCESGGASSGGAGGSGGATGGTGATTTMSTAGTGGSPDTCGNGESDPGEQCDDGNATDGDGCDSNCTPTACGNGVKTNGEECDDGNAVNGDGCDEGCIQSACGNGIIAPDEDCDDGNKAPGDGCGPSCAVETGWECSGMPSVCAISCGDGTLDPGEECDVGGDLMGDGCTANCKAVSGWACSNPEGNGKPSACVAKTCGAILAVNAGASSDVYTLDPDGSGLGGSIQVYCDMVRDGGGWALVLQNNTAVANPNPSFDEVVNIANVTGTFGATLSAFDLFLGLRYWNDLGAQTGQMRIEVGPNPSSQTKQAIYGFSIKPNTYALTLGNGGVTIGGGLDPEIKTYSGGGNLGISTFDLDVDTDAAVDCAGFWGYAWWYGSCWKGSFWGGKNVAGTVPEAYWSGTTADHHAYGALWVK
ncbi:MAG: DUF4215 domain-containing protein [Polyangiaceae bacterium]